MDLEEIGTIYGTQKVTQGFLPIYERYIKPWMSILEIGIAEGKSLEMWHAYTDGGIVHGVDKSLENVWWQVHGVSYHKADAQTFTPPHKFDLIIDDGSHIAEEQLNTFKNLWPYVNKGGYYVVEDLFTLFDPVWNPDPNNNILNLINSKQREWLIGGDDIQEVHLHGGNSMGGILFILKRFEKYRINTEYD